MDFEFKVFSARWGHYDTYCLTLNKDGWYVRHISIEGQSNPRGEPFLFENLEQDFICHPHDLAEWMEFCWEKAANGNSSQAEIQDALTALAEWVSSTEKAAPRNGFFHGFT